MTRTSGVAERMPSWSPDGRWIAYFSDETGEYELYVTQSDGRGETKQLTSDGKAYRYNPVWSPDSKMIVFTDKAGNIFLHTIESKQTKLVDTDPTEDFDSPRITQKLPHVLSAAEVEAILDAPDITTDKGIRDTAILELFYSCGLRISELANLPMQAVYLEESSIRVRGKGSKERVIPIGSAAQEKLQYWFDALRLGTVGRI